ncbi:hypothetical protein SAMN04515674_1091 [Pseudarcicella hirudinis]|uniref:Pentapeptide MXKDX repeat protein n=1 Tax=Pseudarcicella hirudinis TaxID=1079859 RepID=A0A1I5V9P8_9BACT|nr:hypothetical protein [Pseudarcicella hirudinis]SFQ04219.1 hypothetical protein SAMN04515674_1091 [Pseudarcicella hirudinis]
MRKTLFALAVAVGVIAAAYTQSAYASSQEPKAQKGAKHEMKHEKMAMKHHNKMHTKKHAK